MASKIYIKDGNALQSAKRISKTTVKVTIKNKTGYYSCNVLCLCDLKYYKWAVLESAIEYFRKTGYNF